MSCNGCRVLRKGCSESCILRTCLYWIASPKAQANATLFLARFFGRSDLMAFIAGVPAPQRPALFQSLLFEACGRSVNPVNGAVGLLMSGNWSVCQAAVETVLAGGTPRPQQPIAPAPPIPARAGPLRPIRWGNQLTLSSYQPFLARGLTPAQLQAQVELQLNATRGMRRGGMWLSCTRPEKRRRVTKSEESEVTSGETVEQKPLLDLFD